MDPSSIPATKADVARIEEKLDYLISLLTPSTPPTLSIPGTSPIASFPLSPVPSIIRLPFHVFSSSVTAQISTLKYGAEVSEPAIKESTVSCIDSGLYQGHERERCELVIGDALQRLDAKQCTLEAARAATTSALNSKLGWAPGDTSTVAGNGEVLCGSVRVVKCHADDEEHFIELLRLHGALACSTRVMDGDAVQIFGHFRSDQKATSAASEVWVDTVGVRLSLDRPRRIVVAPEASTSIYVAPSTPLFTYDMATMLGNLLGAMMVAPMEHRLTGFFSMKFRSEKEARRARRLLSSLEFCGTRLEIV